MFSEAFHATIRRRAVRSRPRAPATPGDPAPRWVAAKPFQPSRRFAERDDPMTSANKILLAAAVLALAVHAASPAHSQRRGPGDGARGLASVVVIDPVRKEPANQTVPVLGRIVPMRAGEVSARIAGSVEKIHVEVGDRVGTGAPLATLDTEVLRWERAMRAAEVAEQQARILSAEAQVALARQELQRLEDLRNSAAFSAARYDDKRRDVDRYDSAVGEAKAKLVFAQANLRLSEWALRHAVIRAPFPGVISRRHTEIGAYLKVGDALVSVINDTDIEIEADVPVSRLAGLAPGSQVSVEIRGEVVDAAVRAIIPDEDPLARTRAVRLIPEIGDGFTLARNESVRLRVPTGPPREAVTVHKDAVVVREGRRVVFVVADERAEMRAVLLGDALDGRFEVLEGLSPGEVVVVRGNERLRDQQAVRVEGGA